jgi:hypothetical protein
MQTWVLMVLVSYVSQPNPAAQPRALTSVPGYSNKFECDFAAAEAMKAPGFNDPSNTQIMAWCIPGPEKR